MYSTNTSGHWSPPFGSQSLLPHTNSSSNALAPKPSSGSIFPSSFGRSTVYGQDGSFGSTNTQTSLFGGDTQPSQPAFGSSLFGSSAFFGSSSQPAFGSTDTPAFGATSTPALGATVNPASGAIQPAFGSSLFGSSAFFGSSSQPAFGSTDTPAFGGTSTPALGATSTPALGATSTPALGATVNPASGALTSTPVFGSTSSPFGNTGSALGVSSAPAFIDGVAFGASSNSGSSSTSAFGTSSTPAFSFGPTQALDQSSSAFGCSIPFGSTITSGFGGQSSAVGLQTQTSPFGSTGFGYRQNGFRLPNYSKTTEADSGTCEQTEKLESISAMPIYKDKSHEELKWENYRLGNKRPQTPTSAAFGNTGFAQSGFGGQWGGSRVASYSATAEENSGTSGQAVKLESISAMPVYKDKSHEELRWEDYQLGDKGGLLPSAQSTGMGGFSSSTTQTTPFSHSQVYGRSAANLFSSTTPNSIPFAPKTSSFPYPVFGGTSAAPPPFSSSAFGSSTSGAASPFGANSSSSPGFFPPPSALKTFPSQTTSSPFGTSIFGYTQPPSQVFRFTPPTNAQPTSAFGQNTSFPFGQTASFGQSGLFNSPASGLTGSIFLSSPSLTSTGFGQTVLQPPISAPFQPPQVAPSSGSFAFTNFGQTQPVGASSYNGTPGMFSHNHGGTPGMFSHNHGGTPGMFGQNNFGHPSATQSSMVAQAAVLTDPFGTLRALQAYFSDLSIVCTFR